MLAWNSLVDVFTETKINVLQYELGKLAVEQNYSIDKGIAFLLAFIKNRQPVSPDNEYSKSDAYLLITKAYYSKKDKRNTNVYLQKALANNPDNQAVLDWRKELK